jgi:hypothetical protein
LDAIPVRNLQPNDLSAAEQGGGWRMLWDGVSGAGWRGAKQAGFPAQGWTFTNGELRCAPTGAKPRGGDLVTQDTFAAFEFQFDFRLTAGANSGVKYFVTERPRRRARSGWNFNFSTTSAIPMRRRVPAATGCLVRSMI